ncbi:unnamed protein product [Dovyalis caffra]|uniref:F-box domain-containing protein n=1 Tax=Dovyalis caffra TaxID=77055 RepID=A0AAV1SF21_9ROSI|nr:unnamed protein product [Dovyalis caffra]
MAEATSLILQDSREDSVSNCQKLCKIGSEDMISRLPDDILCHILSFLPTKYVMGTSILSKRWIYLWTKVSNLDFDDTLLYDREKPRATGERNAVFANFINRFFIHYNVQSFVKFKLKLTEKHHSSHLSAWISAAIMSNVEELSLCIRFGPAWLPESLFSCEKLLALKLHGEIEFNNLESVWFPNLKVLHLKCLPMLDNTCIAMLLSGSPVLEELKIYLIGHGCNQSVHVSSSSLKRLIMQFPSADSPYDDKDYRRVTVDTPSLEFLKLHDYASEEVNMLQACSLIQADISVGYLIGSFTIEFDDYVGMVVQFLRQISVVKALILSEDPIQSENAYGWDWCAPESVPKCLLSCLEVIEFKDFIGEVPEMEMVEYFLKNAMVLKKMIVSSDVVGLEEEVVKKLQFFPRGSSACQLAFS